MSTEKGSPVDTLHSPHEFVSHTFNRFTYCAACGKFIWGAKNQGKICIHCQIPVHHRCYTGIKSSCEVLSVVKETDTENVPDAKSELQEEHPHSFLETTFKTGTWCDHCGQFCWGVFNQGMTCEVCTMNVHHKCAELAMKNCMSGLWRHETISEAVKLAPDVEDVDNDMDDNNEDLEKNVPVDGKAGLALTHVHSFETVSLKKFEMCQLCDKFIWGPARQAVRCKVCQFVVHHRCGRLVDEAEANRIEEQEAEKIKMVFLKEKEDKKSAEEKNQKGKEFREAEQDAVHSLYLRKKSENPGGVKVDEIAVEESESSDSKKSSKCKCNLL